MDGGSSIIAVGVVGCLCILALTSAADAAMTAISRHRLNLLQSEDAPRGKLVRRLLDDPYNFKAVILLLNTASTITASALTLFLTRGLGLGWQLGSLAILLLVILVFCEAIPKALALRNSQGTAQLLAGLLAGTSFLLRPLLLIVEAIARPFTGLASGKPASSTPLVTEEEIRMLVNVGEEEGLIEKNERVMIEGIISFGDTLVREVMIPRVDIAALESTATLAEAINVIVTRGHSRIPVYQDTIDQVSGVLYAKDILPLLLAGQRDVPITTLLRPPYFVPDMMKVDVLLRDLQARKVHLAIVVDEYGGTAGLVTIEDLIEEIVGDIQDEYDLEEPPVQILGVGELVADARVLLDDLNDLTKLNLHSEESDRLGGLVYEHLGRVPRVNDVVKLPDGVEITVLSVEGLSPRRLRLTYPQPVTEPPDEEHEELVNGNPG